MAGIIRRCAGLACLTVVALVLAGCAGGKESAEDTDIQLDYSKICVYGSIGCDNTYGDSRAIYVLPGETAGLAYCLDPEIGQCAPVCTRDGCSHRGTSGSPNPDCDAYLGFVDCDAVVGNHLYYVQSDPKDFRAKSFCRAKLDGTERKVLHRVEDAECSGYGSYEGGYLIYPYYNQPGWNGKIEAGICLLDLETEKLEQIRMPDNYRAIIFGGTITDGTLYYLYCYNSPGMNFSRRLELWKYDLASGEKSCCWSKKGSQVDGQCALGYGLLFVEEFEGKRHLEDLRTGTVREMAKAQDGILGPGEDMRMCLYDEGVLFYGKAKKMIWHMDTGELETLEGFQWQVRGDSTLVHCITEHWVYASRRDESQKYVDVYMSREDFMNARGDWRQVWK